MLDLISPRPLVQKCDGSSRRDFLTVGSLGLAGGLTLPRLLRARAAADANGLPHRPRSVIFLFLDGGASQLETFDPKPDAPREFRGYFGTVPTTHTGVRFCELLPRLARLTDRMAIVRSFTHRDGAHEGAQHWVKTGYPYPEPFVNKAERLADQNPAFGAILARHRGPVNRATGVPNYVRVFHTTMSYHDGPAWLGPPYAPFKIGDGVNTMLQNMKLQIAPEQLDDRRTLLRSLDTLSRVIDQSGVMRGMDSFQQQAVEVVLGKARQAFDLSREPSRVRNRYWSEGKHGPGMGDNLLLARRLCEAGCGFVSLNLGYWDHHGGIVDGCKELVPPLDHAVSAFLEDVRARGLENDILLVITSEFGRTPRMADGGGTGRDHWAGLNTLIFAGGGLKMNQIIGASDRRAAYPAARPLWPQDLMATLFHVLGIDPKVQYTHPSGRPISMLEDGKVIEELL
jgi:uncharacterized protein (DUF1501 family)